jgi:hypothetical protein
MKKKFTLLCAFVLIVSFSATAQKTAPKSIISTSAAIRKFYDVKELKALQKGELIELYIERVKVLTNTLPYIALASKPGVTMVDIGIPDSPENSKALDAQKEATTIFVEKTVTFQRTYLPFCDKNILINSILYFETYMKALKDFDQQL